MRRSIFSLLCLPALVGMLAAFQTPPPSEHAVPLSIEEVVKLCQTNISEELIITKIKKNGKAFDLSTDELLELKKQGVSDNIVKYLLDPSQPYAPPPPPAPPGPEQPAQPAKPPVPAKKYPADAHASKVPSDPGLYYFPNDASAKIDLKMLLGEQQGAGVGKIFKKKGRVIGYLVGPASKTKLTEPAPVFYLRLPEGKGIEEVVLIAFEGKGGRREIDEGAPGAEELNPASMRQFDFLEVGARLFRVTPNKLAKGEYLFFLVGSAEVAKGNYGKGYDFGIDESGGKPPSK